MYLYIERVIDEEEDFDIEKWIEEFEYITKMPKKSEYLKKQGMNGSNNDEEAFKKSVPLVTCNDIQAYIEIIANGDSSSILTTKPVTSFILRKYPIDGTKKVLMFINVSPKKQTKGGLNASYGSSIYFSHRKAFLGSRVHHCSLPKVRCTSDIKQSTYCNLLCGLMIYQCHDIRFGVLSTQITDPSLRNSLSRILKQDPDLADTIYDICLIPELFPSAKYVLSIMTEPAEKYVGRLRVYARKLPLISEEYVCSKGRVGTNIDPNTPVEQSTYVVLPNDIVESKPLGLTEVKVGQEYEVVITNILGLYWYKLGDVMKFICRANAILSINEEKASEKDLQAAVEEALKHLLAENIKIIDYTSYEDASPK
ncbi:hypothetical protein RND81_09G037400 [Saponaria officinalis]|uniref:GH3 middle domain-containing protein n=1 Tax=Saponaria officinalis TaxID=3572 RepID=A0AAW1IIB9_SAPOF